MNKNTAYWLLGGLVVGLAVVVLLWALQGEEPVEVVEEELRSPELADPFRPDDPEALETVEGGTRRVITEEVSVPEPGEEPASPDIAVPRSVIQVGSIQKRDFVLSAENGRFSPNIIVVNEGDILTISLTAVDDDYDMFFPDFGVLMEVPRGETKRTQFQVAGFGEYDFYCVDFCPGNAEGRLIVAQR